MARGALVALAAFMVAGAAAPVGAQDRPSPIVIRAPHRPYYLIVPPSTDPEPVAGAAYAQARGVVVEAAERFVWLDLGDGSTALVRVPAATDAEPGLPGGAIPPGARAEAVGVLSGDGVLDALQLTLWLP
jgi:hypothetical protein